MGGNPAARKAEIPGLFDLHGAFIEHHAWFSPESPFLGILPQEQKDG
jgi:hypothetical protein